MCPDTPATAPYSPRQRAVVSTTPAITAQRIDGSVMRQKVCQPEAPSVCAACSCSLPISRRVGTTSRATNGTVTKKGGRTADGGTKILHNQLGAELSTG